MRNQLTQYFLLMCGKCFDTKNWRGGAWFVKEHKRESCTSHLNAGQALQDFGVLQETGGLAVQTGLRAGRVKEPPGTGP